MQHHMRNSYLCNDRAAFTLMELAMVVAILSVLLAFGVPNFIRLLSHVSLKINVSHLIKDIEQARSNATQDIRTWALQVDVALPGYLVLSSKGRDGKWGTEDDTISKKSKFSSPRVTLGSSQGKRPGATAYQNDGVTFGQNRVIFNPDGTSVMGTIYLSNDLGETFAVSSTSYEGKISVWNNAGSGWVKVK